MKISREDIEKAWEKVKANNAKGGIDDISIADVEQDISSTLQEIFSQISTKTYLPQPYLQIKIAKDNNEKRTIGLATVMDKIVQQAIFFELEKRLDNTFLDTSYAYRREKGALKALHRVKHLIVNEGNEFIVKCDIDNFFDNLSHSRLKKILQPIVADDYFLELILMFCKMGYIQAGTQWKDREQGVPQGAILSPILSNLYLHSLDQKMKNKQYAYIRYADDFIVLCKTREHAELILQDIQNYITQKLILRLNDDAHIKHINEGLKFLGVWVNQDGFYLKKEKIEKIQKKIENSFGHPQYLKKYQEVISGVQNYYSKIIPQHYLFPIDEFQKKLWTEILKKHKNIRTKKDAKILLQEIDFVTPHFSQNKDFHIQQITNLVFLDKNTPVIDKAEKAVQKRKREYELKEFENHEIIITGFGKTIGLAKGHITIKENGKLIHKISLQNVEHISIQTEACSISSKLIVFCANNKIPIDFTDFTGESEARLYDTMNDMYELWHRQFLHLFSPQAISTANAVIIAKMNNQKKLLQYFSKYAKKHEEDLPAALENALSVFQKQIQKLKVLKSDSLDTHREKLINIEAQASIAYWEVVRLMIDEETNFENRERKGAKDLVNSMLNYGYSILYRHIWTSILQQGLNPSFSYIHQPRKYEGTLIFDLIEPFRQPIVDRAIISMINKKTKLALKDGRLDEETKKKVIVAVNDRLRRYDTYLGERQTMLSIIKKQAWHFVKHLNDTDVKFKPYQMSKW